MFRTNFLYSWTILVLELRIQRTMQCATTIGERYKDSFSSFTTDVRDDENEVLSLGPVHVQCNLKLTVRGFRMRER